MPNPNLCFCLLLGFQVPPTWPQQGGLEFRHVVLSYREGLPNALDGVSLTVRPGEKVGVVGRTGSGKSTLFLSLFRMVELNQGQILLDGLDIRCVGLAQLRCVCDIFIYIFQMQVSDIFVAIVTYLK